MMGTIRRFLGTWGAEFRWDGARVREYSQGACGATETWLIGKYGATLGKMACGIRVVRPDGSPVTYLRAFGRYWAKFLSGIMLLIGYIIAAFDAEKRALHDHICDTRVVYK